MNKLDELLIKVDKVCKARDVDREEYIARAIQISLEKEPTWVLELIKD